MFAHEYYIVGNKKSAPIGRVMMKRIVAVAILAYMGFCPAFEWSEPVEIFDHPLYNITFYDAISLDSDTIFVAASDEIGLNVVYIRYWTTDGFSEVETLFNDTPPDMYFNNIILYKDDDGRIWLFSGAYAAYRGTSGWVEMDIPLPANLICEANDAIWVFCTSSFEGLFHVIYSKFHDDSWSAIDTVESIGRLETYIQLLNCFCCVDSLVIFYSQYSLNECLKRTSFLFASSVWTASESLLSIDYPNVKFGYADESKFYAYTESESSYFSYLVFLSGNYDEIGWDTVDTFLFHGVIELAQPTFYATSDGNTYACWTHYPYVTTSHSSVRIAKEYPEYHWSFIDTLDYIMRMLYPLLIFPSDSLNPSAMLFRGWTGEYDGFWGTRRIADKIGQYSIAHSVTIMSYPLPTGNTLNISFPDMLIGGILEVQIFNLAGKRIKVIKNDQCNNAVSIDLADMHDGVYFCKIIGDGKICSLKILRIK